MTAFSEFTEKIVGNMEKVIVGKRAVIRLLTVAALCDGHVLIEDVPGVAKTMLVNSLETVSSAEELIEMQGLIKKVHVHAAIREYILRIVNATRTHSDLALGASPRGSLSLFRTGQAFAAFDGRDYVIPDDVKILAPAVLSHRLIVRPESRLKRRTPRNLIEEILKAVPAPVDRPDWRSAKA